MTASVQHLALIGFQIMVKMLEHMLLEVAPCIAQRIELRQPIARQRPLGHEAAAHISERLLQLRVLERESRVLLEAF